jgi:uroporphyrinogen-III synthase
VDKEQLRTYLNNPEWKDFDESLAACGFDVHKNDYDESDSHLVKQYRELIAPFEERKDSYQQALLSRGEKTHQEFLEEFLLFNGIDLEENTNSDRDISSDDSQLTDTFMRHNAIYHRTAQQ